MLAHHEVRCTPLIGGLVFIVDYDHALPVTRLGFSMTPIHSGLTGSNSQIVTDVEVISSPERYSDHCSVLLVEEIVRHTNLCW